MPKILENLGKNGAQCLQTNAGHTKKGLRDLCGRKFVGEVAQKLFGQKSLAPQSLPATPDSAFSCSKMYTSEWLKMQLAVWTEKIKSRHARGDQHVSCVGGTLALGLDQVCTTFSYCRPHYFYSYEVRPPMSSSYIYEIVPTNTEHIQTNCVINL